MNREILINKTIRKISLLPDKGLQELYDYVEVLLKSYHEKRIIEGMMKLSSQSKSLDFLKEEEDLYDESDLIEKYQ